jgi:hypothetical protein
MVFSNAIKAAGVGAGQPPSAAQENETEMPNLAQQQMRQADPNDPNTPAPRYLSFEAPEDYLEDDQPVDDGQSDMVAQLIAQNNQLMEMLRNQQAAPQQPAYAPQSAQAKDYFSGYDPEAYLTQFTTDPNAAIAQAPAMQQVLDHIQRQDEELRSMRAYIEQQNYYEEAGIVDPEDRKVYKELYGKAALKPQEVLELAARQFKADRLAKAKEAQGVPGKQAAARPNAPRPGQQRPQPLPFDDRMNTMLQRAMTRSGLR